MKWRGVTSERVAPAAVVALCVGSVCVAQGGAPASRSMSSNIARDTSHLNPENSLELIKPADKSEELAFRDFQHVSPEEMAKKIDVGEKFLKKYPKSNHRAIVYSGLTSAYPMTNQVQKMQESGEMALALNGSGSGQL